MVTRNLDSARDQGDGGVESNPDVSVEQLHLGAGNTVFKSGPLFISSKGIGWTSWKKRWFILTRTSLVFFRSDPNGLPHKGSEDLTLGGIDLNNSGSVLVRADKKLLTVLFPDGRDGRAFTLKAETSEEMYEWKTALEDALAQAPSAASVMGQNGIFRNDSADTTEGPFEQWRKKRNAESLVIGRPMLLALQEVDGNPSFLEKALRFIEKHGVRVEGILRQSADVDEVEHRVQEYEQGKNEFSPDEDAHVVADCVKHVLRELPSSPVPASCCTSLLEAYRSSQGHRASALRAAIFETFPDPNLRLLQRILQMMQTVVSHKFENLMSTSAVAACMAPLLLRPLLAGDCDLENDADTGGDGSLQFLQAAAAANHAQAIVITLLEEFDKIFLADGSFSSELYPESEDTGIEDSTEAEFLEDDGYPDAQNDLDPRIVYDHERALNGSLSETSGDRGSKLCSNQFSEGSSADIESHKLSQGVEANMTFSEQIHTLPVQFSNSKSCSDLQSPSEKHCAPPLTDFHDSSSDVTISTSPSMMQTEFSIFHSPLPCITESANKPNEPEPSVKHWPVWSHSSARKNLSLDSIDYHSEDENAIQKLEYTKVDLQNKISKEVKGNAILQASLEERRQALHDHRSALEQDVKRLQEQLERERALRSALEAGLEMPLEQLSVSSTIDSKIRADIEEIALVEADVTNLKNKVADLHLQLDQQKHLNYVSACESCGQHWKTCNQQPAWFAQKSKTVTTGTTHCYERPPRSEDALPGASGEKVISQESLQPFNKQPSNNELPDSARPDSAKSVEAAASLFPGELMTAGPQSASRKVSGKAQTKQAPQMQQSDSIRENGFKTVEAADLSTGDSFAGRPQASSTKTTAKAGGPAPAQSALTKLANRLSLLRERRSHLVSELQVLGTNKVSQGPLLSPSPRTRSR